MSAPAITLTATVQDTSGAALANAIVIIALCNNGPALPSIAGVSMLGQMKKRIVLPNGTLNTPIWGNDAITPAGTYYTVTILDAQNNIVQCAAYQLTGTGTQDLSNLVPFIPEQIPGSNQFVYGEMPTVAGNQATLKGTPRVGKAMVFYNGNRLRPAIDYTLSADVISLNFAFDPSEDNLIVDYPL